MDNYFAIKFPLQIRKVNVHPPGIDIYSVKLTGEYPASFPGAYSFTETIISSSHRVQSMVYY